jgi:hypothetical protein
MAKSLDAEYFDKYLFVVQVLSCSVQSVARQDFHRMRALQ